MRVRVALHDLQLFFLAALAQQPSAQNPAPSPKLFASFGRRHRMMAKAKSERKPDQPNFALPIVQLAPYTASLENRVGSVAAPASCTEREAEMFSSVEGTAHSVTG